MRPNGVSKCMSLFFLVVVTLIMTSSFVLSYGVAPSEYSFDIDENIDSLKLRIVNSDNEDLMLSVSAKGELSEYINLPDRTIVLKPSENEKTIHYDINLPEELSPGVTEGSVVINNIGGSDTKGDSVVTASVAVSQKLKVFSPYPDEFIDGDFFVNADTIDAPVTFSTHLKNKGSVDTKVTGSILIKTPANEQVGRISFNEASLEGLSAKKVHTAYEGIENPGMYTAEVHLNYGDKRMTLKQDFMIGNKEVAVDEVSAGEFELGNIVKLRLKLINKWNREIEDVSAELEMISKDGETVDTSETTDTDIRAHESAELEAYWDTEGISAGTYDIGIRTKYDDMVSEYYFDAVLGADSIEVTPEKVSGQVTGSEDDSDKPDIYTLVVLLIIAIIVINVSWFFIIKKKVLKK